MSSGLLALLDKLESVETQSLSSGYVDGSFSIQELRQFASICAASEDPDDLIVALLERRLICATASSVSEVRYRSRFGEMVRLLVRLRQIFPNGNFASSPQLVSDFRVDRRARRFPRRDHEPDAVCAAVAVDKSDFSQLQQSAWNELSRGLRLSGFQARSIRRVLQSTRNASTIITAGTGSGKTLAYYLPTFLLVVPQIDTSHWVKSLAIYPRKELLKDQFAEAYRLARLLDVTLKSAGRRQIRIGALFGDTPRDARHALEKWKSHNKSGSGVVFPMMRCAQCGGELIWKRVDIEAGKETLVCSSQQCNTRITGAEIALTRQAMMQLPPDFLFTTTEMLNQRLCDPKVRRLFGVGMPIDKKPLNVLLDEVHTYVDISGAQAALTLRRFRHALKQHVPFIGLSATLAEAERFFSDLIGIGAANVVEVTPLEAELIEEGAEYQILLRSDPAAATLSTSIQAAMFLGRVMDSPDTAYSEGSFGERVFVFTDDLDVTNRLFDNLREAEAYTIYGKVDSSRVVLATLRDGSGDAAGKEADGQRWRLCEDIGRSLGKRLLLGRTTSQDAGVDADADVIVASSSLEVGYNDPHVGAVLQHKTPRSAAPYLQRKGRAGRSRTMRPIAVTVLSDYGRDRISFQAYEHLFEPSLPPQFLPTRNDYILRMQAVYSFIDWLSFKSLDNGAGWLWNTLSMPYQTKSPGLKAIISILERLLDHDEALLDQLNEWLAGSLDISRVDVDALLWNPPRSLLLEMVPTLLRRLERNWVIGGGGEDLRYDWHPLPDFVPRNLFGELNLPEVRLLLPPASVKEVERVEYMPIEKAMSQFAPGRVSRRFAVERGGLNHWFPVIRGESTQSINIVDYCKQSEPLGLFGHVEPIEVFRPLTIAISKVTKGEVLPSSTGALSWRSELLAQGEPIEIEPPTRSIWSSRVGTAHFFLHRNRGAVLVRRYAHEASAELHSLNARESAQIRFIASDGEPAAIGFQFEADGFSFEVKMPSFGESALSPDLLASCRLAYVRYLIVSDRDFPKDLGGFHREWLWQILLTSALVRCSNGRESMREALCCNALDVTALIATLNSMLLNGPSPLENLESIDEGEDVTGYGSVATSEPQKQSRLYKALEGFIHLEEVRLRLSSLSAEIDGENKGSWVQWLKSTLLESLAESVLQACISAAPRYAATDTLTVDVQYENSIPSIWVTETSIGGAGVIQALADAFAAEPRLLYQAVESALSPSDLEISADGLERYLRLSVSHPEIAAKATSVRHSSSHLEREEAKVALFALLGEHGLDVPRALAISLQTRLFRPGSDHRLDATLERLISSWKTLEQRLSISIGPREFAYIAAGDADLVKAVSSTLGVYHASRSVMVQAIGSLLWSRGIDVRQRTLQSYSPYRPRRFTDPAIVRELITENDIPEVLVSDPDYYAKVATALVGRGSVRISSDRDSAESLRSLLCEALVTPVEVSYLRFFPSIERLERLGERTSATLSLRECL